MISLIKTPLGDMVLGTCRGRIVMCDFTARTGGIESSINYASPDPDSGDAKLISIAEEQLHEYFLGGRTCFDLPLQLSGSEIEKRLWRELCKVSYGKVVTYKQVATATGRPAAVRAVASMIGRNPLAIIVPCHRVIGCDGKLHGYAGGVDAKAELLRIEGSIIY